MKLFIIKTGRFLLVLVIPFLLILITYLYFDPFQVVYNYPSYYTSGEPRYVTLNEDYVSMETFLNNYPAYKYDSFIFGNSRSRFYEMDDWSKYIGSDKCFHFDASAESLYGIYRKIDFLNERHIEIKNALVILDYSTLRETNNSNGHLFIKHPLLSGQNRFDFQLEFFKTYCSFSFFPEYLDFKISGHIKEYMKTSHLLDDTPTEYNLKYNEMNWQVFENMIKENPDKYYNEEKMKRFYRRDSVQNFSPQVIKKTQLSMLNSIRKIFNEQHTDYKIIINPLYDQLKLNINDVEALDNIFGAENVFDFSGINSITSDYHNYYEESHYRPEIGSEIMNLIYRGK